MDLENTFETFETVRLKSSEFSALQLKNSVFICGCTKLFFFLLYFTFFNINIFIFYRLIQFLYMNWEENK